jgi:hypothetical protein
VGGGLIYLQEPHRFCHLDCKLLVWGLHPLFTPEVTTLMTLPLSSSPVRLDLATLNASHEVVKKAIQDQVVTWEQNSHDAAARGDFRSAQQYQDWVFAADLCVHNVFAAVSALILETLETFPIIQDTRTVALPNLTRSDNDRYLDSLSIEVASAQPDTDPA